MYPKYIILMNEDKISKITESKPVCLLTMAFTRILERSALHIMPYVTSYYTDQIDDICHQHQKHYILYT